MKTTVVITYYNTKRNILSSIVGVVDILNLEKQRFTYESGYTKLNFKR